MIPAEVEGALFFFRRTGLSRIRDPARPHGADVRTVRVLSLAVSPWGVRMGLGRSVAEETEACRAFIASCRPGFRLESVDGLRPDARTHQALEAVWGAIPPAGRCGVLVAEAAVYADGKSAILYERSHLYNLPCASLPAGIEAVSRGVPKGCDTDGPLGLWMAADPTDRKAVILIPARTESEAAIRFVFRMTLPERGASPDLSGYRLSPVQTQTALEIAKNAGVFSPEPQNDPDPLNLS